MKVGQSTSLSDRIDTLRGAFRRAHGWEITRQWSSGPLSTEKRHPNTRHAELDDAERRVLRHARSQYFQLSDWMPTGVNGETETFLGVSFGNLVAYTDVVVRCTGTG
ncbi:hypothetical protein [Rhodococcus olei]|uniref:hypothetical protein n=1 Tax=Rhodococcus olei TaxID=2161675 RepID=UPI0031EDC64B